MRISRISILFLAIVFLSSLFPVSGAVYAAAGVVTVDGTVPSAYTVSSTTSTRQSYPSAIQPAQVQTA